MHRDHFEKYNDFFIFHFKECFCATVLPMFFWLMNSVCPPLILNLDFKATTEKQHINKAKLHYKSSSDSAKMAVYVSSS